MAIYCQAPVQYNLFVDGILAANSTFFTMPLGYAEVLAWPMEESFISAHAGHDVDPGRTESCSTGTGS